VSLRPDGVYRCDKCGTDVGNGGVRDAAIVSDLDPDALGEVRVLHLCRKARTGAPGGCVGAVFGPATLADYIAKKKAK